MPARIAALEGGVGGLLLEPRLLERDLGGLGAIGIERIRALDRRDAGLGDLDRGHLARLQRVARGGNGQLVQAHSTTFGTAKKPSRASGALERILS